MTLAIAVAGPAPCHAQNSKQEIFQKLTPNDAATRKGLNHFYNMEYEAAIANFQESLSSHPNDPYALNHLLEAILFQELHREGKLDAQLYLSNEFVHQDKVEPDPEAVARVQDLIEKALDSENQRLSANPNDVTALYARSVTRGLHAAAQGMLYKAWFAALRSGLGAYDDSKKVLQLDPSNNDAKLIVGIYNYVVGSLPWPVKLAALLVTIHGSKSKGLALMKEAANGGGAATVDARTTLGLFLAREHRYQEALELTQWLYSTFPHNFMYGISEAGLLRSAGKPSQAIQAYRRLIELGKQGQFGKENIGLAAVNLGNLFRSRRDWRSAAEAFESVASLPNPKTAVVVRARMAAGEMYDLAGERQLAIKNYQAVLAETSDERIADVARQRLKQPYAGD